MDKLTWYYNRMRTMSLPEIGYRSGQFLQKRREKKGRVKLNHTEQDYQQVLKQSWDSKVDKIPEDVANIFSNYNSFSFFGHQIQLTNDIDWHFDVTSGKRFPLSFSKDIDIRSDRFGSAKAVWEINRLQFLLPLAVRYAQTKDPADLQKFVSLLKSWINENPYLRGVNWYSNIEVNIRLIVWYFCWQVLWQNKTLKEDKAFVQFVIKEWLPCIYEHCVYSHANPSKYSSANNHLVAEYSGLFVASCCWPFSEYTTWRKYALKGLENELQLQYSKNGINKEEASEYIQFITDLFLIPFAVGKQHGISFSESYRNSLYQIFTYLTNLLDIKNNYRKYGDEDDGKVLVTDPNPHFDNFASILTSGVVLFKEGKFKLVSGQYELKNWLLWGNEGKSNYEFCSPITSGNETAFYPEEGHFIFKKRTAEKKEIYLHLDAAPLGFLSIAAHGHADALSVALTLDGNPFLVDPGTFTYHTDANWRNFFISTMAHNTICIDGKNQALQAGPTMWLKHYQTKVLDMGKEKGKEWVSASHNGYEKLGCSHRRTVVFEKAHDRFVITDTVHTNNESHQIHQPWHLHPGVKVTSLQANQYHLKNTSGGRSVRISFDPRLSFEPIFGQESPVMGWYSPSFLQKEPTTVLLGKVQTTEKKEIIFQTIIEIL